MQPIVAKLRVTERKTTVGLTAQPGDSPFRPIPPTEVMIHNVTLIDLNPILPQSMPRTQVTVAALGPELAQLEPGEWYEVEIRKVEAGGLARAYPDRSAH